MRTLRCPLTICAMLALAAATLPAQTFQIVASFDGNDGYNPTGSIIRARDGNFYGTASVGPSQGLGFGCGTIFRISPPTDFTVLHILAGADGCNPNGGLIQARDGNFYGTTNGSVTETPGTIFRLTPAGAMTTLYTFCSLAKCADGSVPFAGLVQGKDGNLYGTTTYGGTNICPVYNDPCGTVFRFQPKAGKLTTLYSFCAKKGCRDGAYPRGSLVEGPDGDLYGTTSSYGEEREGGTVFRISRDGKLTTLHHFCHASTGKRCADGAKPMAGLILAADGNFYGTTALGGSTCAFGCGTVFKITPQGALTTLHRFTVNDGFEPKAPLVEGVDGNFYGTTYGGGATSGCKKGAGCGTVFRITSAGALKSLLSLSPSDGIFPWGGLLQAPDGALYGTTTESGPTGSGRASAARSSACRCPSQAVPGWHVPLPATHPPSADKIRQRNRARRFKPSTDIYLSMSFAAILPRVLRPGSL